MRSLRAAFLLCALGASGGFARPLAAQVDAFDAAALASSHGEARAAGEAVLAFLRIPPGVDREARLAAAAALAFAAGDHDACLRLAEEAQSSGLGTKASRVAAWRSRVAKDSDASLLRSLRSAAEGALESEVDEVLLADEQQLVPLADARMREGAIEEGLWLFEALATRLPADPVRIANHALALRHAGRLDESKRQYERALELAPKDTWTWNDYGLLLRVRGDREAALAAFRRAYDLDARPGEGPGITNLVLEAVLRGGEDPLPRAKAALATRPDAALLRRAVIDHVLRSRAETERQQLPDKRAGGR